MAFSPDDVDLFMRTYERICATDAPDVIQFVTSGTNRGVIGNK